MKESYFARADGTITHLWEANGSGAIDSDGILVRGADESNTPCAPREVTGIRNNSVMFIFLVI